MKTRKTKRSLSLFLTFALLISALCSFQMTASAEATAMNGYKSSDFYTTTSVSNGPWSNQYYDFMTVGDRNLVSGYTDMAATKERNELTGTPTVWVSSMANDSYSWGNKAAFIGADVMKSSTGTTNWINYNSVYENYGWTGRNYPVKVFTAPQTGYIKISAAAALTATEKGTDIRVTTFKSTDINPTNVWPAGDNAWQHISGSYNFSDIVIAVEAGDKVAFENAYLKNADLANTTEDTLLYWDPVVTYLDNYKSSDFYTPEAVTFGPWSNQYYDFMTVGDRNLVSGYADMAATKERGELTGTPTVWVSSMANDSYSWGNKAAFVGADVMKSSTGTTNWTNYNSVYENYGWTGRNYGVKTFTAPKSGYITISAADVLTATEKGTDIRVTTFKTTDTNPTNVWPAGDNAWQHISGTYNFSDIVIAVEAGDKVAFENAYLKNADLANTTEDTLLYWDPVVTYLDNYKSSDFYTTEAVTFGPWSNQYYDFMTVGLADGGNSLVSGYTDMAATKERGELTGTPTVWVSSMANDNYSWGNKAAYVGATVMSSSTGTTNWSTYNSSIENAGWTGRNYGVKTFTAPKSGYITISAADVLTATEKGTDIRITTFKTTDTIATKVWPKATSWQHISGSYTFSDIVIPVAEGEKVVFENAYIKNTELANTAADTLLYWDPVISYTDLPYVDSVVFANAEGGELTTFAEICAADSVTVDATVSCAGKNGVDEITVAVAVYGENGGLVSVGFSDAKAIAGENSGSFTFELTSIPTISKGSIKVFIFDNMASLTPITDIGSTDYILAD